jgi:hypothetical protein
MVHSAEHYMLEGMPTFQGAILKIERAEKHIRELNTFMESFTSSEMHSVEIVKGEAWYIDSELQITIHKPQEELRNKAALIIGDVYHNIRSALDILWFEIVSPTGLQTKYTRFPILDTREQLIAKVDSALEKGQITAIVHEFVGDVVKPYREGNFALWSIEEANIIDKHQLLIPNVSMIGIVGVRIQNDKEIIEMPPIFTESSFRRRANHFGFDSFGTNPKVLDQGRPSLGYAFDLGHPQEGKPVLPTLNAVTKEVTRTIESFILLLGEG